MLTEIELENFRNYNQLHVSINSDMVLILGDNAAGKTNFLESIYYLSVLKSFRSPDGFLARSDTDHFSIKAKSADENYEVICRVLPTPKRSLKINDVKVTKPFWKSFTNLLFVPQDLNLFILGPPNRRKLFDDTAAQIKKDYASDLVSLEHVLKQRSALLERVARHVADRGELSVWNLQLAELAERIGKTRQELTDFFAGRFDELYAQLTGFKNKFNFRYHKSAASVEDFLALLSRLETNEIHSGQNLLGPHREDWVLYKDGVLNIHNSSRGELRSQILALKLIQAQYFKQNNSVPIILLDDVFSELDETRRQKMLSGLSGFQVFITSTEEHHLPETSKRFQIFKAVNDVFELK